MKHQFEIRRKILIILCGLAMAASTSLGLAQITNNPNAFNDDASDNSWAQWSGWGVTFSNVVWDATRDASNNPASGSLRAEIPFVGASNEQFALFGTFGNQSYADFSIHLNGLLYTNLSFDIRIDPSTLPTVNNNYGTLEVGFATPSWGQVWIGSRALTLSATNWTHVVLPINPTLAGLNDVVGIVFKLWSNGAYTHTLTFNLDNVWAEPLPSDAPPPPPPTMSLLSTTPGLQFISTTAGGGSARYSIRSAAPNCSWIGSSTPTTYEVTIKDYPRPYASYPYFQTHMFLIPAGSLPYGTGDSSPDWNSTNLIFVHIQNNPNGSAYARFMYKTNVAGGGWGSNPQQVWGQNTIAALSSPSILGTWSLSFSNNTQATLAGPGGVSTNFTLPAAALPWFTDAAGTYFYLGMQPNGSANVGQSSVIGEVKITGAVDGAGSPAADIDDAFPYPPLDSSIWGVAASDANGIQVIGWDTPYWLVWTVPDTDYTLEYNQNYADPGAWYDPMLTAIHLGALKRVLVPIWMSELPSGYFRLTNAVTGSNSINTVGYKRFDLAQGSAPVSIPMMKMASYQIGEVIRMAPASAQVVTPAATNSFTAAGQWDDPAMLLRLGSEFQFNNPDPAVWPVTFVGEVVTSAKPVILLEPVGATVNAGDNARLTSMAGGNLPLNYQWRLNGANIDGATDCTLTLLSVQASQAGPYTVEVSNSAGSIVSTQAVLVVISPAAQLGAPALADGVFSFTVDGVAGHAYVVEAAADLSGTNWIPVATNQAPFTFSEPIRPAENRFFRVTD
ncbi:MAG TPA: immunoglobulin domain-containing protein [Candidatus Paceibacterota bacterium]|nr:immunoglobulin domain-containing protein [Verrucomicrobiota bacterium]HOX00739.1 immunoglobulin domain-containing protein [Verrucomicrobiota bacterium]HRZ45719.1 immunoglobulin domain-containing protein [Candidatus Paceibacterota bacterium]HRZ94037.1 immunoglobulin domain-containing protein [Candidatus Paceibacterota bacterium]